MQKNNILLYFAPEFDEIELSEKASLQQSVQLAVSETQSVPIKTISITPNVTISKYPIISYTHDHLSTVDTNIFTTDGIVVTNINVNGAILSVYNISLSSDIISAQINNKQKRIDELNKVNKIILSNKILIVTDNKFSQYKKTDINFMVGSFEIVETKNGQINEEYLEMIKKFHCSDIYRYHHLENDGYTNTKQGRTDYIMLLLTEDMFNEKSPYYSMISEAKDSSDMLELIFKRFNLHIIQTHININEDYRVHFPIENVFIFKT